MVMFSNLVCLFLAQYMGSLSTQLSALTLLGPYASSCSVNWWWSETTESRNFWSGGNTKLGRGLCDIHCVSEEPWQEMCRFGKQANSTKKTPGYMSPIFTPKGNWFAKHCHSAQLSEAVQVLLSKHCLTQQRLLLVKKEKARYTVAVK